MSQTRLPDLPGMVRGIVGMDDSGPRTKWTLQCEHCFALETPELLVLMKTRFHSRSPKDNNPRLCPPCRMAANPGCTCDGCREDKGRKQ